MTRPVSCEEWTVSSPGKIPPDVFNRHTPLVLRGLVSHWPAVQKTQGSIAQSAAYLLQYYQGTPLGLFFGPPEIRGRFFYNSDFTGFNFEKVAAQLDIILKKIDDVAQQAAPPAIFVGGTQLESCLPGFTDDNAPLALPKPNPLNGLWIGNQTRVAPHNDLPSNIACCVAGRRRFTLFPPEQLENLYVGPLDFTLSGQAISLVDINEPNIEKFPRYAEAQKKAIVAELSPGDAIFVPTLWWHQVEALSTFNILVNYWWRESPDYVDSPLKALKYALMTVGQLNTEEKRHWQHIFHHYLFADKATSSAHIPAHARGSLDKIDALLMRELRASLLEGLKR
ncbi:cupin-like domain-containing protein [Alteromonas pelagimontana]|uniref:Cupin-like domain-containing protein n=1 Tax=Alteromonas pelagimontana TaxID=1858656 RepID=A0A6M4MFG7_9ALTE|nr:cupin-like domain-containing protein [Alteromonas pelagimontana]QJR81365.1 cupin-like domain-containing protein [Alteromonas pelagimontana]